MSFSFLDFDLSDGEISLLLKEKAPANEAKGYVPAYRFNIIKDGELVGKCDIRIGSNDNTYYGGNIGYEVFPAFRGDNYAEKACRLLMRVAAAHGMSKLYITCSPDNIASRKTCENLGARLLCISDLPADNEMYVLGQRQKCVFVLTL